MDSSFNLTLEIILAVGAGIAAQVVAAFLRLPSIVFLLLFGITLGVSGLHWLHPQRLGQGLEVIVALSVAIILFEGGLNLGLKELRTVSGSLRNLVTFGALLTLVGGGVAAHFLAEFPWPIAFLYGSLVVVTGPTVVGSVIKQVGVERSVAALLEGEGVFIDPIGAILAVVVLETILNAQSAAPAEVWDIAAGLALRLGVGVGIGVLAGWSLSAFLKRADFLGEEISNLVVLASVWGVFGVSQALVSESGLMATVALGIVLNSSDLPDGRLLKRFKGKLTLLCVSVLFILLAADLSLGSVLALGWGSLGTVLILMFAVRPLSVYLCTFSSSLSWQQKVFLAWIAPRGIVAASVASLFGIVLTERGVNGGEAIKALVFLTIMMTVFAQGLTAKALARLLRLTSDQAAGAVIIGCTPLGRLLARLFQSQGESVVLIDTDPEACRLAQTEDLSVFQSSALDPDVLDKAGINSLGTLLALTPNGEVNWVLADRALEEFKPPKVWIVGPERPEEGANAKSPALQTLMDQACLKRWNLYLTQDQVKIGRLRAPEDDKGEQIRQIQTLIDAGELLPLFVKRQGTLQIIAKAKSLRPRDDFFYLLHDPRPALLKRLAGGASGVRLPLALLPEAEELSLLK
ncbi:MAG: cation:proton antiporter [Cyanobacteriota bacterium]|nr:cation:proton antiporter [Cyanobacteriota bacterium]